MLGTSPLFRKPIASPCTRATTPIGSIMRVEISQATPSFRCWGCRATAWRSVAGTLQRDCCDGRERGQHGKPERRARRRTGEPGPARQAGGGRPGGGPGTGPARHAGEAGPRRAGNRGQHGTPEGRARGRAGNRASAAHRRGGPGAGSRVASGGGKASPGRGFGFLACGDDYP
jgi:hypothetical protein